jgi:hypothetical protein
MGVALGGALLYYNGWVFTNSDLREINEIIDKIITIIK